MLFFPLYGVFLWARCTVFLQYVSLNMLFVCPLFSEKYMMAVIVGTIGGVAVIAFIIAAVRYVGHNNKK